MEKRQTSQQNMRNVRAIALDILLQVMEEGKYCDRTLHRTLNREDTLSKQQRAFLTRLVEGTVEQAIRLDYIIDCFSKTKVVKMKPVIRETLRMAVYQLFYMDQVPDSAACNEAVKLVRKRGLSMAFFEVLSVAKIRLNIRMRKILFPTHPSNIRCQVGSLNIF